MSQIIEKVPSWHSLKKAESNKVVQSMHIWLILVPVIAKSMSLIESPFVIVITGKTYVFDISLPFTWVLFFGAALFFTLANIIFISCSPKIIKENNDLSDFERAGKDVGHLENYFSKSLKVKWSKFLHEQGKNYGQYKPDIDIKEWFWKAYDAQDSSLVFIRVACTLSYVVGFGLITIVGLQNIWWVIQQINL